MSVQTESDSRPVDVYVKMDFVVSVPILSLSGVRPLERVVFVA